MIPTDIQQNVAQEVNDRLAKATRELQAKYERGEGGVETSEYVPTGEAYKQKDLEENKAKKASKKSKENTNIENTKTTRNSRNDGEGIDEADDDEDYELRTLREQRLRRLKASQMEKIENLRKGHGQFREITQDEFLKEVTGSKTVICHFYHRDFPRCVIMDHHIAKLAPKHVESKFIKINAEKAPFFIEKVSKQNT